MPTPNQFDPEVRPICTVGKSFKIFRFQRRIDFFLLDFFLHFLTLDDSIKIIRVSNSVQMLFRTLLLKRTFFLGIFVVFGDKKGCITANSSQGQDCTLHGSVDAVYCVKIRTFLAIWTV